MLRNFAAMIAVWLFASAALAETGLTRLDTGDDSRGWEAVGRLDLDGHGYCTATLIAVDRVLTAAHCLYDKRTGKRVALSRIEFLAGLRNGRAAAYRGVRRAVLPPDYVYGQPASAGQVRHDLALLELQHPIRNRRIVPFGTDARPRKGGRIGVVSYARGRSEAPSLQKVCEVLARQQGVLVMSCDADFGASGAPVFSFRSGVPRVVSVVSAMARAGGNKVSLGTDLQQPLAGLRAALAAGAGVLQDDAPQFSAVGARRDTGAHFARPGGS